MGLCGAKETTHGRGSAHDGQRPDDRPSDHGDTPLPPGSTPSAFERRHDDVERISTPYPARPPGNANATPAAISPTAPTLGKEQNSKSRERRGDDVSKPTARPSGEPATTSESNGGKKLTLQEASRNAYFTGVVKYGRTPTLTPRPGEAFETSSSTNGAAATTTSSTPPTAQKESRIASGHSIPARVAKGKGSTRKGPRTVVINTSMSSSSSTSAPGQAHHRRDSLETSDKDATQQPQQECGKSPNVTAAASSPSPSSPPLPHQQHEDPPAEPRDQALLSDDARSRGDGGSVKPVVARQSTPAGGAPPRQPRPRPQENRSAPVVKPRPALP